jgi:hypothetical protein
MSTVLTVCRKCENMFMNDRPTGRGRYKLYCPTCAPKVKRELANDRVARYRAAHSEKKLKPVTLTIHINTCNGRTYCGRLRSETSAEERIAAAGDRKVNIVQCKTCRKAFNADLRGDGK